MPASKRSLSIDFDPAFPHEVLAFEERVSSPGGGRVTRAVRTHVPRSAYWTENAERFRGRRALPRPPCAPRSAVSAASRRLVCPNCGATFAAGRLSCPECGSDERTGWKDPGEIDHLSVDLPDAGGERHQPLFGPLLVKVIALLAAIAFVLAFAL